MLSNRIFPTNQQDSLGSELEIVGIDWDDVNQRIAHVKEGNLRGKRVANDVIEEIEATQTRVAKKTNGRTVTASKKRSAKASTEQQIRFTDSSQISHEALEEAKKAGDQRLTKAILAARNDRRVTLAKKLEALEDHEQMMEEEAYAEEHMVDEMEEEANDEAIEARAAYRKNLVREASRAERYARSQARKKVTANAAKSKSIVNELIPTAEAATRSAAEKNLIRRRAKQLNWSEKYVQAMYGISLDGSKDSQTVSQIKEIMASKSLARNVKVAAASALIRTAKLDDDQKNRIVRFWRDELKYGDPKWIEALVKDYKPEGKASG
jgi:hypothetical protein